MSLKLVLITVVCFVTFGDAMSPDRQMESCVKKIVFAMEKLIKKLIKADEKSLDEYSKLLEDELNHCLEKLKAKLIEVKEFYGDTAFEDIASKVVEKLQKDLERFDKHGSLEKALEEILEELEHFLEAACNIEPEKSPDKQIDKSVEKISAELKIFIESLAKEEEKSPEEYEKLLEDGLNDCLGKNLEDLSSIEEKDGPSAIEDLCSQVIGRIRSALPGWPEYLQEAVEEMIDKFQTLMKEAM